jgi:hypothetical protein
MAQKDSVLASLCVFDHHAQLRIVMFASLLHSLITRAANLRASSSSCRIVPSALPYSLTLSRHVTIKWYRGKCATLFARENSGHDKGKELKLQRQ